MKKEKYTEKKNSTALVLAIKNVVLEERTEGQSSFVTNANG